MSQRPPASPVTHLFHSLSRVLSFNLSNHCVDDVGPTTPPPSGLISAQRGKQQEVDPNEFAIGSFSSSTSPQSPIHPLSLFSRREGRRIRTLQSLIMFRSAANGECGALSLCPPCCAVGKFNWGRSRELHEGSGGTDANYYSPLSRWRAPSVPLNGLLGEASVSLVPPLPHSLCSRRSRRRGCVHLMRADWVYDSMWGGGLRRKGGVVYWEGSPLKLLGICCEFHHYSHRVCGWRAWTPPTRWRLITCVKC